jgi:hypothetical protein
VTFVSKLKDPDSSENLSDLEHCYGYEKEAKVSVSTIALTEGSEKYR